MPKNKCMKILSRAMHKQITGATLFITILLAACGQKHEVVNTDIGVAEAFINHLNQRHFDDAGRLMVSDKENSEMFEIFKTHFEQKPAAELMEYAKASIVVHQLNDINDSTSLLRYSLSIKQTDTNELKMVKQGGQWLVDLKHTLTGAKQ
jgi:hypothetical protein